MPRYKCELCRFSTQLRSDYSRHLLTTKHCKAQNNLHPIGGIMGNEPKKGHFEIMNQNEPELQPKLIDLDLVCGFCLKSFSSKASKRRHEIHRCNYKSNISLDDKIEKLIKDTENLRQKLSNQKGNSTINNNNNTTNTTNNNNTINTHNETHIHINSFGEEDLSYISDKVLTRLLKYPGSMVANLILLSHFHEKHPENNNVRITNAKSKHVGIYSNGKWIKQMKSIVIDALLNSNFGILEEHFDEKAKQKMVYYLKRRFELFRKAIENEDKQTIKTQKDNIELALINNSQN